MCCERSSQQELSGARGEAVILLQDGQRLPEEVHKYMCGYAWGRVEGGGVEGRGRGSGVVKFSYM